LFEIICVINQIRPLVSIIPSGDIGLDSILQMLSGISDGEEGEKVCKVIDYINQDGEKETLYPFAVIQGHCYYYNKNHDTPSDAPTKNKGPVVTVTKTDETGKKKKKKT
jgi:hypothetical protein